MALYTWLSIAVKLKRAVLQPLTLLFLGRRNRALLGVPAFQARGDSVHLLTCVDYA